MEFASVGDRSASETVFVLDLNQISDRVRRLNALWVADEALFVALDFQNFVGLFLDRCEVSMDDADAAV